MFYNEVTFTNRSILHNEYYILISWSGLFDCTCLVQSNFIYRKSLVWSIRFWQL